MENSKVTPALQNPVFLDEEILRSILTESMRLAAEAALKEERRLGGSSACGFAWVEIHGIRGNTRLGRLLKRVGIEQGWNRAFHIWNPSGLSVQSVAIKEAGADACAKYLRSKGFKAYSCSRLD